MMPDRTSTQTAQASAQLWAQHVHNAVKIFSSLVPHYEAWLQLQNGVIDAQIAVLDGVKNMLIKHRDLLDPKKQSARSGPVPIDRNDVEKQGVRRRMKPQKRRTPPPAGQTRPR